MVIQSKLPFELNIYIQSREDGGETVLGDRIRYYDDLDDLCSADYEPEIVIFEGRSVRLKVHTDLPFKLTMDGFDAQNSSLFQHEDGVYLAVPDVAVDIFSYDDFSLPPGYYALGLECGGKIYYTGYKIVSLRLDANLWRQMAEETAEEIQDLAYQMVRQKLGAMNTALQDRTLKGLYYRMGALEKEFPKVVAALNDLRSSPHSRIVKTYLLTDKHWAYAADFKSQRLNGRNQKENKFYLPVRHTDYNLAENRYVKRVVEKLQQLLRVFLLEAWQTAESIRSTMQGLRPYQARYKRLNNVAECLRRYMEQAQKINYTIGLLQEMEWYQSVPKGSLDYLPMQSALDPRYSILNKLSKDLQAKTLGRTEEENLARIWKNSNKLYELWGFIKIVQCFREWGFEETEFFQENFGKESEGLALESGDVVCLQKEAWEVHIAYDRIMPGDYRSTKVLLDPVYSLSKHRQPDCKVDFYRHMQSGRVFVGSLIIDFKYRPLSVIWNRQGSSSAHQQLFAYGNYTKSRFIFNLPESYANNALKPVYEVWALYPDNRDCEAETLHFAEGVRLMALVPGHEEFLRKHLRQFMDDYITASPWVQ